MALYGHEIDATITPWEADLAWIVKLDKGDFIGRDALVKQKEQGITRKLIGFEMRGRGIGRDGYEVHSGRIGGGLGDQRRTGADAKQKHRPVISAGTPMRDRPRHPRDGAQPAGGSSHRPDPFLQTSQIKCTQKTSATQKNTSG